MAAHDAIMETEVVLLEEYSNLQVVDKYGYDCFPREILVLISNTVQLSRSLFSPQRKCCLSCNSSLNNTDNDEWHSGKTKLHLRIVPAIDT